MNKNLEKYLIKKDEDIPMLRKFSILSNFNDKLRYLSSLAEEENWDNSSDDIHPILFQYLFHTFNRVVLEDKLMFYEDDTFAMFNTGLLSKNGEDIYALFKRTTNSDDGYSWYLDSFYKESARDIINLRPLPEVVDYYKPINDEKVESYFDASLEIICNMDHILDERNSRMPELFRTFDSQTQQYIFTGAFAKLKKKLARNPRLAVPQIYRDKMTYLLPIDLCQETVALAVERFGDTYRANTVLTLEMAYTNARLLATPDSNWLINKKVDIRRK